MTTSIKRIIVGYDSSDGARCAAEWARAIAGALRADVVVLAAAPPSSTSFAALEREMASDESLHLEPDARPGPPTTTALVGGEAREVLAAVDRSHGADLVIVGRQGSGSGPGLFHTGSVAEYLAHHTRIPLVVVPTDVPVRLERLVVGVDGSPASHAAARWCAELAAASGAGVTAVAVHEPFLEWKPEADIVGWRHETERRILEELAPELTDLGVDVTPVAVRGATPVDGILHAAGAADLVVLGLGPTERHLRLRAGGAAFGALHSARCAVALVPDACA